MSDSESVSSSLRFSCPTGCGLGRKQELTDSKEGGMKAGRGGEL